MVGSIVFVSSNLIFHKYIFGIGKTGKVLSAQDIADMPSSQKVPDQAIKEHSVAPDLPKYINIPKLKVHSRVFSVNLDIDGALDSPKNIYDTGWYVGSSKPGQNGAVLIDGHYATWQEHGVFYELSKLKAGDEITLVSGDDTEFRYKVTRVVVFAHDSVDMPSLLVSDNTNRPGLNLISCIGKTLPNSNKLDKRVAVYSALE